MPTLGVMKSDTLRKMIDVGPSRLAYERTGRGPDLVFVHGWPLDGRTWRHIVPRLAARFTCHVLDLPGTGKSEWTRDTPFTLAGHAAAVQRAIESLGIERCALIAHDSGATIARLVAAELGDRCFGLVLGNTEISGYRPPMLVFLSKLLRIPGGSAMLGLTLRVPFLRRSWLGFGGCFHDRQLIDGDLADLFIHPLLRSKRALEGQLGLLDGFDWTVVDHLAHTHARILAPVALVWGRDDPWFPLERARAMQPELPGGCELVEIADAKLFAHEECPREWAEIAEGFLTRWSERRERSRPNRVHAEAPPVG